MANFPLPIVSSFGSGDVAETIRATRETIKQSRDVIARADALLGKITQDRGAYSRAEAKERGG